MIYYFSRNERERKRVHKNLLHFCLYFFFASDLHLADDTTNISPHPIWTMCNFSAVHNAFCARIFRSHACNRQKFRQSQSLLTRSISFSLFLSLSHSQSFSLCLCFLFILLHDSSYSFVFLVHPFSNFPFLYMLFRQLSPFLSSPFHYVCSLSDSP